MPSDRDELAQSEERFRLLAEHSPIGIAAHRGGHALWANAAFLKMFGRISVEGVGPGELNAPSVRAEVAEIGRRRAAGLPAPEAYETLGLRSDGTEFPILVRAKTLPLPDGPATIVFIEDLTERRRAETALRASEEQFRRLFEAAPIGIGIIRRGTFVSLNPAALRMLGYDDPAGIVGRSLLDAVAPECRDEVMRIARAREMGQPAPDAYETTGLRRDGTRFPIQIQARILQLSDGPAIVGFTVDLTAQKQAQEALRTSEERFRTLVEGSPIAIAIHRDGRPLFVNAAFLAMLGYDRAEEVLSRPMLNVVAPSVREQILQRARNRDAGLPEPDTYETTGVRKDDREFPILTQVVRVILSDGPAHLLFVRDLTDQKRAQEALLRSEEQFRTLVEGSPIAIAIAIHRDASALFVNAALQRMFGYGRAQEVLDRSLYDLLAPSVRDAAAHRARNRIAGLPEPSTYETLGLRKDGVEFPILAQVVRVSLSDGPATVVFISDLTEQKRTQETLRQTAKMEAIGRLAGGIAHDFNNLLQVISGFAESLTSGMPPGPSRDEASEIVRAAGRAASLTRQLLAFGRRQVLAPRVIDLNAVISDMVTMLQRLLGADVDLVTDLDAGAVCVKADRGQLEQVLLNLAANARDAMPRGGRLRIATHATGAGVALDVSDTGEGMDTETLAHLFEPFFTTKSVGKGTGLGLATVYGIVTQSGGELRVESAPGQGTVFHITLPRIDEPAAGETPRATVRPPGGKETVLIAEDEDGILHFMTQTLRLAGYRALPAATGPAALDAAAGHSGVIDLLVSDVILPQLNGPEVAQKLSDSRPGMKVLYVSGHTGPLRVPQSSLLEKPFTAEELLARVRAALDA